ncbi:WhiB family transcriptional regulator [Mycobacterium sp. DL440]|uniref:WhiB family transcriptional regulator n=1 Tax=Mycobacterium sp. DL440 TaxID=2675523 RepID=UPI001AAF54DC|nr:WhiB family transcriptional regulator [Mycobacterium sp. DL440]
MTTPQPDWRTGAACRGQDPELFFPDPSDDQTREVAESICATCTVRPECMAAANAQREKYGVWAGFERNDKGRPSYPPGKPPRGGYRIGRNN